MRHYMLIWITRALSVQHMSFWFVCMFGVCLALRLVDLRYDTGSDSLASLSEGESRTGLEGDVVDEVSNHLDIVTGHNLNA